MSLAHLDDHREEKTSVVPELQALDDTSTEFRVFIHGRPIGGVWADDVLPDCWWWTVVPGLPAHGRAADRDAAVRGLARHLGIQITDQS
jgi:hypothetical protein